MSILFHLFFTLLFRRVQNTDYHQYETGKANHRRQFYPPSAEYIGFETSLLGGCRPGHQQKTGNDEKNGDATDNQVLFT